MLLGDAVVVVAGFLLAGFHGWSPGRTLGEPLGERVVLCLSEQHLRVFID